MQPGKVRYVARRPDVKVGRQTANEADAEDNNVRLHLKRLRSFIDVNKKAASTDIFTNNLIKEKNGVAEAGSQPMPSATTSTVGPQSNSSVQMYKTADFGRQKELPSQNSKYLTSRLEKVREDQEKCGPQADTTPTEVYGCGNPGDDSVEASGSGGLSKQGKTCSVKHI